MITDRAKQLTDEAIARLIQQLEQGRSDALKLYLKTMARFHRYSFWNSLLIAFQRPEATRVAGFHTWRGLGRHVNRGERGIAILAPMTYGRKRREYIEVDLSPDANASEDDGRRRVAAFKVVYVFDVAQTEGEPLAEFAAVGGSPGEHAEALKRLVAGRGIALEYSDHMGGALGSSSGGRITLRNGLTAAEEFTTLAHELAHELLHRDTRPATDVLRAVETEAEAVAFIVCHAAGLDTSTASSDYIQLHHGDRKALEASLTAIRKTASEILTALQLDG